MRLKKCKMSSMIFKKIIPQKFTNRIVLLIGLLGFLTAAVNTGFTIYTNYKNTYEKVFDSIEIQYDIFADDFAEALLLEDIYSIYSEINEISASFDFVSNIYVFDSKGKYFTDAKAARKFPGNIPENLGVKKEIKAGATNIGEIFFILNKDEIKNGIYADIGRLALVNILIVIAGVAVGILLARLLASPLKQLTNQINRIDPVDFSGELNVPKFSSYEVVQLKEMLDNLSRRLNESISQIKTQQKKINNAERLASIGTMAAGLAHELKNPIMSLKLISDTLLNEYEESEFDLKRDMEMISAQSDSLVRRINTFLIYAKPIESKIEDVSAGDFITTLKLSLSKFKGSINIDYDYSSNDVFIIDKEQLSQVLENLVQNSYEAGANSVFIHFCLHDSKLVIKYKDNGCGFANSNKSEVFRPFFTTKKSGSGLGLAMCEKIVESLDGHIEIMDVESGASFKIEIIQNGP